MNIPLLLIYAGLYFSPLSDRDQLDITAALTVGSLLFNIEAASIWILLRFLRFDPSVKRFSNEVMHDTGIASLMQNLGIPTKGSSGTKRPPYAPYDYTRGYVNGMYGQSHNPYLY
ncbi:uncharacterized protein LOC110442273 [Mizuhopecten yessoensis]|uniref:Uncharacterized protein n=1 Tax=Mizuhopecten yessoensis TaxID=6573 RepID=A0A210PHM0_MIZYE|nr:uncharacterized protein LOC110442273 [Mizuhopecten yessoensis]XP_021341466.1 uncharacterized protein LOC110442273 [Mizuhopecten yessoensis]XP_021341467.1 uncharacterized protein LOC110442273 [Mizuhopecten yessoensis]OWF35980.1 hypothetical protein KP79_PYT21927 [Mizuhopecten yessoensis]